MYIFRHQREGTYYCELGYLGGSVFLQYCRGRKDWRKRSCFCYGGIRGALHLAYMESIYHLFVLSSSCSLESQSTIHRIECQSIFKIGTCT